MQNTLPDTFNSLQKHVEITNNHIIKMESIYECRIYKLDEGQHIQNIPKNFERP